MTDTKKRYHSKTIVSQIVSAIMLFAVMFGLDLDQGTVTELIMALINVVTLSIGIYGRISAKKEITL